MIYSDGQMGVRLGHLPHSYKTLWIGDGQRLTVVLQLYRFQVDTGDEDRVGVLAVPHVCGDQHRGYGRVQFVRLSLSLHPWSSSSSSPSTSKRVSNVVQKNRLIPETKGRSLEEMDVIFGAVQAEKRRADIEQEERQFAAHAGPHQQQQHEEGSVRSEMEKV